MRILVLGPCEDSRFSSNLNHPCALCPSLKAKGLKLDTQLKHDTSVMMAQIGGVSVSRDLVCKYRMAQKKCPELCITITTRTFWKQISFCTFVDHYILLLTYIVQ